MHGEHLVILLYYFTTLLLLWSNTHVENLNGVNFEICRGQNGIHGG